MGTYNEANSQQKSTNKYTVTFKTPWEIHSQIQDIVTITGMSIQATCCELMGLGIETFHQHNSGKQLHPKQKLYRELGKVRERNQIINILAELKENVESKKFMAHCHELGIDPDEVPDICNSKVQRTKEERCHAFLRFLFYERPNGIPVNVVIELVREEGFGENMTRKAARNLGLEQDWGNTSEGRVSLWKPKND